MTTRATKPVYRELTGVRVNGRNLVVGIHPSGYITVRLKGTGRTAEAHAGWIYRNRHGIAKHQERLARRRARKERAIELQSEMMAAAIAAEKG